MTANVINRVKPAVDIIDADRLTVNFKALGTTGFDIFSLADFNEVSHFSLPFLGWRKFLFNIRTRCLDSSTEYLDRRVPHRSVPKAVCLENDGRDEHSLARSGTLEPGSRRSL